MNKRNKLQDGPNDSVKASFNAGFRQARRWAKKVNPRRYKNVTQQEIEQLREILGLSDPPPYHPSFASDFALRQYFRGILRGQQVSHIGTLEINRDALAMLLELAERPHD